MTRRVYYDPNPELPLPPKPSDTSIEYMAEAATRVALDGMYAGIVMAAQRLEKDGCPRCWVAPVRDLADAFLTVSKIDQKNDAGEREYQSWLVEMELQSWGL